NDDCGRLGHRSACTRRRCGFGHDESTLAIIFERCRPVSYPTAGSTHATWRPNGLMLSRVAAPPSSRATRSVARSERRKPRASKRRYVGSCNELGAGFTRDARPIFADEIIVGVPRHIRKRLYRL